MRLYAINTQAFYPTYVIKKGFHYEIIRIQSDDDMKKAYILRGILYDESEKTFYSNREFDVFITGNKKTSFQVEVKNESITKLFS